MTTKSNNSSTTAGSGPSKFRKDAAIFSPNNYVHPNATNHMPTSPNSINQIPNPMMMGMHPMNGAMMGNPIGGMGMTGINGEYNPYVTANGYYSPYSQNPQYEFNPYAPMQYAPPVPYMAVNPMYMGINMNTNMGMNIPIPPDTNIRPYKRKNYKPQPNNKPYHKYDEATKPSDTSTESPSREEDTGLETKSSIPESSQSASKAELVATDSSLSDNNVEEPSNKQKFSQETSEILKNLPLYVNSSHNDFFRDSIAIQERKNINSSKTVLNKQFIIVKPDEVVIDYNEYENEAVSSPKLLSEPSKKNWASVVSSSVKKPVKPKANATTSTTNGPVKEQLVSNVLIDDKKPDDIDTIGTLSIKNMFNLLDDDKKEYFRISSRGLTNTGNICYMNSILQVLIYCEPFNELFKLIDLKTVGSLSAESKTPLIDAFIGLFKDFNIQSTKSLSPEGFYMKINKISKFAHLKWGQQEDAEELLGYLLDGLHEEFIKMINEVHAEQINSLIQKTDDNEIKLQIKNAIKVIKKLNNNDNSNGNDNDDTNDDDDESNDGEGWNEIGGGSKRVSSKRTVEIEPSPIKSIFGGQFRSVLQIQTKKDQSITLDPFQCIQLDIKDDRIKTIEEAFKHLNEPEQIPFKLNDSKEVIAKKQTFIDNLPKILMIHLKRFSFENTNGSNIEKLRKKIKYDHKLTIPIELFSNWRKNINKDYKLTGVVYHHGVGAEGGHYTSDVLKSRSLSDSDEWIRIDDTSVTKIDKDDALNNDDDFRNAYILFYQRL